MDTSDSSSFKLSFTGLVNATLLKLLALSADGTLAVVKITVSLKLIIMYQTSFQDGY